jgi:hypothetical protein
MSLALLIPGMRMGGGPAVSPVIPPDRVLYGRAAADTSHPLRAAMDTAKNLRAAQDTAHNLRASDS